MIVINTGTQLTFARLAGLVVAGAATEATATCYEMDESPLIPVGLSSVQVVEVRRAKMTEAISLPS